MWFCTVRQSYSCPTAATLRTDIWGIRCQEHYRKAITRVLLRLVRVAMEVQRGSVRYRSERMDSQDSRDCFGRMWQSYFWFFGVQLASLARRMGHYYSH